MTTFDDGTLHVDFAQGEITIDGKPVDLTTRECLVLATLVRHQGQVLSLDQLEESVWDDLNRPSDRVNRLRLVNVVFNLRHELSQQYGEEQPIETVEGFGYRYRPQSR